jgi:hypothetical protein
MFRRIVRLSALFAALSLCACGSLPRPEGPLRIAPEHMQRVEDPRIGSQDSAALELLAREMARRISGPDGHQVLALSGGGANGAYGAGVIVGWTQRGDRPTFDIVTGVSTGALAAPFAFLGSDWDDELEAAYTDGRSQTLLSRRNFAVFQAPSLFNASGLRNLVDHSVTPQLLAAIAAEHAKGRRLLVATTNLDTEETVIWDMGVLASQGEAALPLFRDVLVASASIPGVFPPVLIGGVNANDEVVMEMHVDGGVNTPFLAIPEPLLLWTNPERRASNTALYVIVNGQMGRNTGVTPGRLSGILARTYDSMSKASLRTALAATGAFTARNGMNLSVSAIPDNVTVSSLKFDPETMQALFDLGRRRSASGEAWTEIRPSNRANVSAPTEVPEGAIPDALKPRSSDDQGSGLSTAATPPTPR